MVKECQTAPNPWRNCENKSQRRLEKTEEHTNYAMDRHKRRKMHRSVYIQPVSRLPAPLFHVVLDTELRKSWTLPQLWQVPWLVGPLGVSMTQK